MFEMTETCHDHSHVVLLAVVYRLLVTYRTSRVNHILDAGLVCQFNTVREGEEGITCHGCTL